jgi:hypothetical protein
MDTFIAPLLSAFVCATIESIRINSSYGKVLNINKLWTVVIAVVLFVVCIDLSVNFYDDLLPHHVLVYAVYYMACRGIIYDVWLNILRGLDIDYTSKTTNSKVDRFLNEYLSFWEIRLFYGIIALSFGFLWQLLFLNTI